MGMLTVMKGIPLAYNKDMQEDKEQTFDAIDTVKDCIHLFTGMLRTITFNKDVMAVSAMKGFTNATDAADYLVKKGVPFRDAHEIIGRLVLYCIDNDKAIEDCSIEELQAISGVFGSDVYEEVSLKTCVDKRLTKGGPAPDRMKECLKFYREYLENSARLDQMISVK